MHQPQNVAKVLNSISPVHITYKNALGMLLCLLKVIFSYMSLQFQLRKPKK